jgi:hypothetical protein
MRWLSVLLTASSALALAACGGGDKGVTERTIPGPTIERAVAEPLATRGDRVAQLLESGDSCGAASEAAGLESDLIASINSRKIPGIYQEDLLGDVHEIQARIPACEQPKAKHKKKKNKHGDEGDE